MLSDVISKWALRFVNPELVGFSAFIDECCPGWYDEQIDHLMTLSLDEVRVELVQFDRIMNSLFVAFLQERGITYSASVESEMNFEKCLQPKVWADDLVE